MALTDDENRLFDEKFRARDEALRVAVHAMDKRLDAMNEFRDQLKDQSNAFFTRAEHDAFAAAITAKLATNWPILISFVSVVLVLLAGAWGVVGLKIDAASSPLHVSDEQTKIAVSNLTSTVTNLEAAVSQHNTAVGEIPTIKQNYGIVADRNAAIRTDVAKLASELVEIQNQLCAADTVRNLMHENNERIHALLWQKIMAGSKLPTDSMFYPITCHHN